MLYLFPHKFKRVGLIIAPLGFALWLAMQYGMVSGFVEFVAAQLNTSVSRSWLQIVNVSVAVSSFTGFLFGMYFLSFSKERVEDEMVQQLRLRSFQFAAFLQIISLIAGFFLILILGDPEAEGFMMFFILLFILFWLTYIVRFNYILHLKMRA